MPPINPYDLLSPRDVKVEELQAASDSEVRSAVLSLLEIWFKVDKDGGFMDGELVDYAGVLVGRSGHPGMDVLAWEWASKGDARSRVVAGWWLGGYWFASVIPSPEVVAMVQERVDSGSLGVLEWQALTWSLLFAFRNERLGEPLRSRVRRSLASVARSIQDGAEDGIHLLEAIKDAGI
jgi:hypothetical protein